MNIEGEYDHYHYPQWNIAWGQVVRVSKWEIGDESGENQSVVLDFIDTPLATAQLAQALNIERNTSVIHA